MSSDLALRAIERCPIFRDLSRQQRIEHLTHATEQSFAAGTLLFRAGEPATVVHVLVKGRVKFTVSTPEGRQLIVHLAHAGELCGWPSVLASPVYLATARAVEEGQALAWDRAYVERETLRNQTLWLNSIHMLSDRVRAGQQRYVELTSERVAQRLARTLVRLCSPAEAAAGDFALDIPLTRDELAQLTGTTLFTVSRLLHQWQQAGIVTTRRGGVLVENLPRLSRLIRPVKNKQS